MDFWVTLVHCIRLTVANHLFLLLRILPLLCCIHQPVDEVSDGLTWAIWEGRLEDVAFLFNTGVEVNRKDQVRSTFRCHHTQCKGFLFEFNWVVGEKPEQAMQSSTELVL